MNFTIALLQMTAAGNDQAANLAKGERFCRETRRRGADLAPFDMTRLRDYRQREAWGNAFRRHNAYHDLIDPEIRPPFQRTDARGRPFR